MKLCARKWFLQEVHRAATHGLDCILHTALRSEDDYRQVGAALEDLIEDIEALLRAEVQIQQDGIELFLLQKGEAQFTGGGRFCVMAFAINEQTGRVTKSFIVVDD